MGASVSHYRSSYRVLYAGLLSICACALSLRSEEIVSIKMPDGQTMHAEVLKLTKDEVLLKSDGKEQKFPIGILSPKEVLDCYKIKAEPMNAQLRFDMGAYFLK